MTTTEEKAEVVVVFRFDKGRDGSVFALFPEEPGDTTGRYCSCYQHIGQHSSADYYGCIQNSRPAKPHEYADLAKELERIGYVLKVRRRATYAMHEKRRNAVRG